MTLSNLDKELDSATVSLMADSVVTKLFVEIEKFLSADPDVRWFTELMNVLQFSSSVEIGFGHARSLVLAIIQQQWDNLPYEIRSSYGFAFLNFARQVTGKERSTIDNYTRTAKVWFMDKVAPAGSVRIAVRDEKGKPTGKYEYKEFNPALVDMSKLLIVNRRAATGEMTDRLWEMLVDPVYTCDDLQRENSTSPLTSGELPQQYFELLGPGLFYTSNTETVCIAEELNWVEYDSNPVVKEAIDRLLKLLDVHTDEDILFHSYHKPLIIEGQVDEG